MKRYAIIGASGLIGSHLTKELLELSQVFAFSRNPLKVQHSNLSWTQCNLEIESVADKIPKEVDAIIYLAQSEHFRDFPQKTTEVFLVNVQRYFEVLNYATKHKVKHVIYASSGGVYQPKLTPFDEEDNIALSADLGFYLGSKICSETISNAFSCLLNIKILRFFFVYGEAQKEHMLIPRLIKNIREKKIIALEGKKGVTLNPVHVNDAVDAIKLILNMNENKSNIYNIAGKETYALSEICAIAGSILGIEPIFEQKKEDAKKICGDIQKIKQIGWEPKISLLEGLKTIINEY